MFQYSLNRITIQYLNKYLVLLSSLFMKPLTSLISIISLAFLISSCGTARIRHMSLEAREVSPEMFVQTKDMTIIPVTESTRKDYKDEDLIAFQDKRSFNRIDGKKEYVRLIKGRMNLYYVFTDYLSTSFSTPNAMNPTGMSTHTRTHVSRYFDLGLDKPLIYFNRENLGKNISGCKPCKNELALYDQKRKGLKWWKYANFASMAGSLVVAFSGPQQDASKYTDLQIYGFPLLLFGGFGSELYRLSRVGKNEIRLEEAVNMYNQVKY
jgi:hypothetical protein